ncbi:hypothetical protein ON010_g17908 [Phytophthora cinnamomi]|nr:hypothetical protein ON010_g17908 [Phytophthora cinnamomi]
MAQKTRSLVRLRENLMAIFVKLISSSDAKFALGKGGRRCESPYVLVKVSDRKKTGRSLGWLREFVKVSHVMVAKVAMCTPWNQSINHNKEGQWQYKLNNLLVHQQPYLALVETRLNPVVERAPYILECFSLFVCGAFRARQPRAAVVQQVFERVQRHQADTEKPSTGARKD